MAGLEQPLRDLDAWVRHFKPADMPVWDTTATAREALREAEEQVAPSQLAAVIEADPLLTLKFMADLATRWRRWGDDDAELPDSVLGALVMSGISPFFAHFGPQMTLQVWLQDQPAALEALAALHRRSERAGRFALAFAVHRADPDASLLALLARLQDVTEKLSDAGIRVVLDGDNQKIGYKIRAAQQVDRVPYMLVLGANEAEAGNISVRDRKGETTEMSLEAFTTKVTTETRTPSLYVIKEKDAAQLFVQLPLLSVLPDAPFLLL